MDSRFYDKNTKEFEKDKNVYVHRIHTVGPDTKGDFLKQTLHMNFAMVEKAVEVMNEIGKFDIIHAHDWLTAYAGKTLKYALKMLSFPMKRRMKLQSV